MENQAESLWKGVWGRTFPQKGLPQWIFVTLPANFYLSSKIPKNVNDAKKGYSAGNGVPQIIKL